MGTWSRLLDLGHAVWDLGNIFHTSNPKDTSKLTGYLSGSDTTGSLTLSQYVLRPQYGSFLFAHMQF